MAAASNHTPVLIVGGGPVGFALAGDLGWRGVPCVLIEKTDGAVVQPKMDLVGVRTMEFCRRWGIVDWVESCPYPRDYKQDYVYVTTLTGYELGREPFPSLGDEPLPPQSPQKRERCPQDMFDPILKRFAGSFAHVELNYETELIGLEQTQERVIATVAARGETRQIAADHVIGADGGASTVRSLAGITMSGNAVLTYTTNAIIRSSTLRSVHDKGDAYRFIFIGPEGTWATIVAIDGRDRYRFSLIGSTTKKTYSEREIREAVVKAVGVDFEFEIESVLPWIRRELVADSYGAGRIYIAGDAAHLMSPTGGFGMNTGIADSVDLGWKLAAMTEGWGGRHLLSSYEVERRPVALRNVQEASGNLNRMLSNRAQRPPASIFSPGPAGDHDRAEYGAKFAESMRREWFTIGVHLGFYYEASPICWPDGTPPPVFELADYKQTARPGSRAPHAWIGPHRSTLDLFGRGFTLLQLGSPAMDVSRLHEAAAHRGVPVTIVKISDDRVSELYGRRLVLVRPDGHVAWRGNSEPEDAGAVIDVVSGRRSYTDPEKPDAHARM